MKLSIQSSSAHTFFEGNCIERLFESTKPLRRQQHGFSEGEVCIVRCVWDGKQHGFSEDEVCPSLKVVEEEGCQMDGKGGCVEGRCHVGFEGKSAYLMQFLECDSTLVPVFPKITLDGV